MQARSVTLCAISVLLGSAAGISSAADRASKPAVVDAQGNIQVPLDYRSRYEYLGTWSVADDKTPGAKQLHIVYASPGSVSAYKKTGHFTDGSVLVKEVFAATTETMTTGTVSREAKLAGWFVMVTDSNSSHPDNKLWGDGWGWSWFDAGNRTKTTSTNYVTDCLSCHIPAKDTGWIYTKGYSILQP
jgi:hypothetical protein